MKNYDLFYTNNPISKPFKRVGNIVIRYSDDLHIILDRLKEAQLDEVQNLAFEQFDFNSLVTATNPHNFNYKIQRLDLTKQSDWI